MTNKEVLEQYNNETWVIEEVLCYLLQEYKDIVRQGKWQSTNIVGFVKNFMKDETYVSVEFAEKSKMETLEANIVDIIDENSVKYIELD